MASAAGIGQQMLRKLKKNCVDEELNRDRFDQKRITIDFDHFDQKFGGIEIEIIDRHLVIDAQYYAQPIANNAHIQPPRPFMVLPPDP
ncbi:hypothetical protein OUZ56_011440 [Daphnia magna]|uniref:Uncharacterized protein n=1 Tax=Daphnia magna TaxID=35525 RepID=A0ABQ9Z053_9CRUS|nr:hypothetical protein OUZ56_011440 [Daphnia magna]